MHSTSYVRDMTIGLAFLGAIVVMGYVTLKVTDVPFLGDPQNIEVTFDQVGGLRTGDEIRLLGFPVGTISEIAHLKSGDGYQVRVHCRLKNDFTLASDSIFEVHSAGPLGGRYVSIVLGNEPEVLVSAGEFKGTSKGDLFEQLQGVVDEVRYGNGLINQLIENESLGQDFASMMKDARETVASINKGEGILGSLIKNVDLRQKFEQIVTDIGETTAAIERRDGTLGLLVHDSEFKDSARKLITNAQEISASIIESRGTLGKLINDPTLHTELEKAVTSLRKITGDAAAGEGALHMFLDDVEFRDSLKEAVSSMKEIAARIERGDGTVGALINERGAYDRLYRILVQAEDAIEDFREQAPISTFVNAIFSVF